MNLSQKTKQTEWRFLSWYEMRFIARSKPHLPMQQSFTTLGLGHCHRRQASSSTCAFHFFNFIPQFRCPSPSAPDISSSTVRRGSTPLHVASWQAIRRLFLYGPLFGTTKYVPWTVCFQDLLLVEAVPGKFLLAHGSLVRQTHRNFKLDGAKSAPRPQYIT
ncbi:hypothetical protein V8C35DRAFT_226975 [Trichoderma chlorosporum]